MLAVAVGFGFACYEPVWAWICFWFLEPMMIVFFFRVQQAIDAVAIVLKAQALQH